MARKIAATARLIKPMYNTPLPVIVCRMPSAAVKNAAIQVAKFNIRCGRVTESAQCWFRAGGRRCRRSQSDRRKGSSGNIRPVRFRSDLTRQAYPVMVG